MTSSFFKKVCSTIIIVNQIVFNQLAITVSAYQLNFNIVNRCPWRMDVYSHNPITRRFDHRCNIPASGGSCNIVVNETPFHSGLIKNILGEQATLFEFSKVSTGIFYDISVIPPGSGNCYSWNECFNKSRKRGFNDALNVIVDQSRSRWNSRCKNLFCRWEQCPDAYLWPFDDLKTQFCSPNTQFRLEYC
jgi:hypothetical protein